MEQEGDRAMKRVLRKLSALRATLGEAEQRILDELIVRGEPEVQAHARTPGFDAEVRRPGPDEVQAHARTPGFDAEVRRPGPDEVQAHARTPGFDAEVRRPGPDEVQAHARTPGFDAEVRRPEPASQRPVWFDIEHQEYRTR